MFLQGICGSFKTGLEHTVSNPVSIDSYTNDVKNETNLLMSDSCF